MKSNEHQTYQDAIRRGQNFLRHWCIDHFKKIVEGKETKLSPKEIALLHAGQVYLVEREQVNRDELKTYVNLYFRKNPLFLVDEPFKIIAGCKMYGPSAISIDDCLEIQIEPIEYESEDILQEIAPIISQIRVCTEFDLDDDRTHHRILEKKCEFFLLNTRYEWGDVYWFQNSSWLFFQVSDLVGSTLVSSLKVALNQIISSLNDDAENPVNKGYHFIKGMLLYAILKTGLQDDYAKEITEIIDLLKNENSNFPDFNWKWKGAGANVFTAICICALDMLEEPKSFVDMYRAGLLSRMQNAGENQTFWKHDLFTGVGIGWDVWTTTLVLRALEGPNRRGKMILSEEEQKESLQFRFNNKWHIHFGGGNTITFNEIPIKLTESNYRLLFFMAVELFKKPYSEGWLQFDRLPKHFRSHNNVAENAKSIRNQLEPYTKPFIGRMELIETNKSTTGEYRLSSHRRYLSFNLREIRKYDFADRDRIITLLEANQAFMYPTEAS